MSKSTKRSEPAEVANDAKKAKKDVPLVSAAAKIKEMCKGYPEYEEMQMEERTGEEDLKMYKETCTELRQLMTEILDMKGKGKMDEATKIKMNEKRIQASLLFVSLKKLNRFDKLRLKKMRDLTHDAKQRVDTFHLQLENLLYEVFHLRKEVDKCLEFKSKDEDIELISVEEFYQEAPPSISKNEITQTDRHKQTLARLEWEFEQRKRLSEQCRSLEINREKSTNEISSKQKQLESLLPKLNTILEATRPLQEEFNLPVEKIQFQKELAALLPDPLYILYSQIKAFIEACDPAMQISIEGKKEEALNFGSKLKTGLEEILEDVDSAESDIETDYEANKRTTTSSSTKTDQLNRHPLRIIFKFDRVSVFFSYVTTLDIVTVDCKSSQDDRRQDDKISSSYCLMNNMLSGLFPNDHGDVSPNMANNFQAKFLHGNGKSNDLGKPYQWAQRLAGLDFNGLVKTTPKSSINTDFVSSVVTNLKNRIIHRFQLDKVFINLEKGELNLNAHANAAFPPAINTRLVSWTAADYESIVKQALHVGNLLNFVESNHKNMLFFLAVFQRDSAKLNAVAMVPIDYPNSSPMFAIELDWHGKHTRNNSEIIRKIESEVNLFSDDLLPENKIDLLTVQLKKLALHLDLITEIDGQLMQKGSSSWQTHHKPEFVASKMIPQLLKGHDRITPTKFDASTGFFLHR